MYKHKKIWEALLVFTIVLTSVFISFDNITIQGAADSKADISADSYANYCNANFDVPLYDSEDIVILANQFVTSAENTIISEYAGKNNVLLFESGNIWFKINVSKTARYNIILNYIPMKNSSIEPNFRLLIDGKLPFEDAAECAVKRYWVNADNEVHKDAQNNEYAPQQIPYGDYATVALHDVNNLEPEPYAFVLTAGTHIIKLENPNYAVAIVEIKLSAPEQTISYKQVSEDYIFKQNYSGEPIVIEGEDALLKSTSSLSARSDSGSPILTPSSAIESVLNYIGGSTWQSSGEELIWEFEVPEDGLYKMGFLYKQSGVVNGTVYRHLKIDGNTPFDECKNIKYYYSTSWQFEPFGDEEAYLIYLDKGVHTLSLTATLGETAEFYARLKELIFDIGQLYLDIIMITGESPDPNRDYDLFRQIPDFNQRLKELSDSLTHLGNDIQSLAGEGGSQYSATIRNITRVLKAMIENPYTAQDYIADYYTQYTNMGTLLSDIIEMPLQLDQIRLAAPEGEFDEKRVNLFEKIFFSAKRLIGSFITDYTQSSTAVDNGEAQLKIWCNWGREQAMVLNSLIQESFTEKTGISVNLEITNATLIKGILSDTQPDLALHMSRTDPVNLAMRGALVDLSKFSDYNDVMKRFGDTASIPYEYGNGVYALPDTQNFYLMFYRTDIFEKLGISVPETWDDFLQVTASIARNNMTVYLPYTQITSTTTVNTGVGGLNLFASILGQYGLSIYNDKKNACVLEEPIALSAFKFWTDMYTKYKIPTTQNFYNRFKIGTCPLGIEVYTVYTQLKQTAPEIEGNWDIALVPGVNYGNSVKRTISGSGTGCAILEKSKLKKEAWEFLKWWTSSEIQLAYNNGVESMLGAISRTTTATLEAFENMSWDSDDLDVLLEQRKQIIELPEIPGGYYLTRAVDQAYWAVINGESNEKDALTKWGEIANNEIARKIKQYGN